MANTNYHININKVLILENYLCALQKRLLLGNNYPEFAIGIPKGLGKSMIDARNILLVINKVIHNTAAVMRSRSWQSEPGCEPLDCDRYDYHKATPYACGSRRSSL
jgi:hypothetical protein